METYVNGTTAPWILGSIGVLVLFTIVRLFASWRDVKRSPYFFLRQRAEKRLRACLWTIVGLLALAGGTLSVARQMPPDATVRRAILARAKPAIAAESSTSDSSDEVPVISLDSPDNFELSSNSVLTLAETIPVSTSLPSPLSGPASAEISLQPTLPPDFDQFEPTAELEPETTITPLVFSSEISEDYDPVSPRRVFGEGFFTIYATFDYEGMADGMEWAWIWRHDGEVVNGGNELWSYGDDGPGWIYYEPPEGFSPGEYTLEIWINGELFQQASLSVESETANR